MTETVEMLSVADAQEIILGRVQPCGLEPVPLLEAVGRVLAQDVVAQDHLPPFDNSGMDGYAVRADDVAGASQGAPITLTVVADIAAGHPSDVVIGPGQAARIMTGALLPQGADAVVPVEWTDEPAGGPSPLLPQVKILQPPRRGESVRLAGGDVQRGTRVLGAGIVIRPVEIALLAALGVSRVHVIRRPRVAVLATGDELVQPGEPLGPGQIRDANSWGCAAQVLQCGGTLIRLGIARDTAADVRASLQQGLDARADLFLVSAGVSVGAYDLVKDVVGAEGELDFWRVRMRPGKPLAFGKFYGVPFFGLPGNPVSALVTFEQFVRAAILKMSGRVNWRRPTIKAELADQVTSDGRETYVRALVRREGDRYVARLSGAQASNVLSALVAANALVIIPEGQKHVEAGTWVTAQMLDWPEQVF
jgi:molybdopterin molybdotransferase